METPRGANRFMLRARSGRSLEIGAPSGRSRWCRLSVSGDVRGSVDESTRNRSERTLPKSLTTRARAAALRLIGQPASRGSPRGRTHRRSEDFRCRVGLDRARFRLDPPGPGSVSARLCRARSADLSSGRSRSREGNPRRVDTVPSIACRRRVSIRVFLTDVPRDGCGLPGHPPKRNGLPASPRRSRRTSSTRVSSGEPTRGIPHKADMLACRYQVRNRRSQSLECAPDKSGLRHYHLSAASKRRSGSAPKGSSLLVGRVCDPRPRNAVSLRMRTAYKKPGLWPLPGLSQATPGGSGVSRTGQG